MASACYSVVKTMRQTTDMMKLTPAPVLKPWGLKRGTLDGFPELEPGTGELWLASAQTGEGNYSNVIVDPAAGPRRPGCGQVGDQPTGPRRPGSEAQPEAAGDQGGTLAELLVRTADQGDDALRDLIGPGPLSMLRANPLRGKTEAWIVREAVGHTGVAAGPRTPEQKRALRDLITGPGLTADVASWPAEVRDLFGLIEPLRGGEAFLVPAGTLHTMFAVGPQSRLIIDEIQQGYGAALLPTLTKILLVQDSLLSVQVHPDDETVRRAASGEWKIEQDLEANPTVRLYDFGRRPGEYPELGFELTDPAAGLRRVPPIELPLDGGARMTILAACTYFMKRRYDLPPGSEVGVGPELGSYRVLHARAGEAVLCAAGRTLTLRAGETVLIPAAEERTLLIAARDNCCLYEDSVPQLDELRAFLAARGASEGETRALLDPPRAIRDA